MNASRAIATGRSRRGFTLIEVMVALAVVAMALVAVLPSFGVALRLGDGAEAERIAMLTARSLVDRLAVDADLRPGVREGSVDGGAGWRATIRPVTAAPGWGGGFHPRLAPLSVTLEVLDAAGRPRAALSTILLGRGS